MCLWSPERSPILSRGYGVSMPLLPRRATGILLWLVQLSQALCSFPELLLLTSKEEEALPGSQPQPHLHLFTHCSGFLMSNFSDVLSNTLYLGVTCQFHIYFVPKSGLSPALWPSLRLSIGISVLQGELTIKIKILFEKLVCLPKGHLHLSLAIVPFILSDINEFCHINCFHVWSSHYQEVHLITLETARRGWYHH